MNDSKVKLWERQPGESEKAFEAFVCYRDMGENRTVSAVVKKLEKSRSLLDRWKGKYQWEKRVAAYDNDIERQAHNEKKKLVAATRKRQLQIAAQLEKKALEALNLLEPGAMSPRDIKELLRLATDLEKSNLFDEDTTDTTQQHTTLADSIITAYESRIGGKPE